MSAAPTLARQLNRAEVVDQNFQRFVREYDGPVAATPAAAGESLHALSTLPAQAFDELFESQLISRHLDLMARVLRVRNKVFYTIGSSGHEGNAMVARACRHTDPAFLHYRSGAFMAERFRKLPNLDPIYDSALSFAASREDPASGGRHKVWGSKPLWVLPQTSTIASHPPKAYGTALAIEHARRIGHQLPIPDDSIVVCSFGDASANHSTAQGTFNACEWAIHQGLKAPLLFICEDNNIGISVRTPAGWIESSFSRRQHLRYFQADGLDLVRGWDRVQAAVDYCRRERKPAFLHMRTARLMGHAGTDFEVEYRPVEEICAAESLDPLLKSAQWALESGLYTPAALLARYEGIREQCFAAADRADKTEKITSLGEIVRPLAPYSPDRIQAESERTEHHPKRMALWGSEERLPENQLPKHMAIQINQALHDLMLKYPNSLIFGEDVARKGGVYTVTKGLFKAFKGARIFNTLLDEQTILGLAQGYANLGYLPIPEIQYLAYYHNACDQLRGEACSLQFFSNDQYRNPMLLRVAGLGYQKGFGGHFHNDNSFAALRDIPGLIIACPSRGDDAAMMLRTLMSLCMVDGRVCAFLEPIALYMRKDLYAAGDGQWCFPYPEPSKSIALGEPRIYDAEATDLLIISYGNGLLMGLKAAKQIGDDQGLRVRTMDLRWLLPLNEQAIVDHAKQCKRVLIVDEGRRSASVGEGIMTALVEGGVANRPIARVVGADTYTPLAGAATLVLPSDESVLEAALNLLKLPTAL